MPRVSRSQTDKNRETIELVAGRLFREQGIDGISVARLMQAAGLTHGGFYGHFDSKEALAAVACGNAFDHSATKMRHIVDTAASPGAALATIAGNYLASDHCDQPGTSCPATTLATDVARETPDKPVRAAYIEGVKQLLAVMATVTPSAPLSSSTAPAPGAPRDDLLHSRAGQEAMMQLVVMVGAVTLARATAGDPLAKAMLEAGRACIARLADSAGPDRP